MKSPRPVKAYLEPHRFYRFQHLKKSGWVSFQVRYRETDLWIRARSDLSAEALQAVMNVRRQLELYITEHPSFLTALEPLPQDPLAPEIVRRMLTAAGTAGVGPMASVAGTVAQAVAEALRPASLEAIVENGGDCFFDLREPIQVGLFAGPDSPFSGRLGLKLGAERFPLAICTSSATVGHSLSFGKADAVVVLAKEAALADAAATAVGNLVRSARDIQVALDHAKSIPGVEAAVVVIGQHLGACGDVELTPL
ncbi:MAG: UPF0280 family protein [Syntrophobacteraceae bacterium]